MKKLLIVGMALIAWAGLASAAPYLVYDSGGSQDVIQAAMTASGFSFDVRDASNPVTAGDLASHKALVVGWSAGGFDMSGLNSGVLAAGITGNMIFPGHDADYHSVAGVAAAKSFFDRAVLFAGSDVNCGILAFPVYDASPFGYLPSAWGITAYGGLTSETIDAITVDGNASGLYSGLTLATLSNWGQSFHAGFSTWGAGMNPFEIGSPPTGAVVTIGTTKTPAPAVPEPSAWILMGLGLVGATATAAGRKLGQ
ncbi:MAG: PEP-CTERM sorting domain-containing protein [Candidatus Eisenbacteria bacterium]|nr:PEP-CTERM sorting domain-containing protein [Candidatus Eisenbacteria bacterium]